MRFVLIGPRGSGKTSVGRLLAKRIGCAFVDLDDVAAAQFEERTVREIWAKHGEAAWRAAEVRTLRSVLDASEPNEVVALGGGTPVIPEAHDLLLAAKTRGLRIVYLKCAVDELARRLAKEPGDRPSITDADVVEEISHVLAKREAAYQAIADVVVDAAAPPERVVDAVLQ